MRFARYMLSLLVAAFVLVPAAFAQKEDRKPLGLLIEGIKPPPTIIVNDRETPAYADREGYIPIQSFSLGFARGISSPQAGRKRESSPPNFSEVAIQRTADGVTTDIMARAAQGTVIPKVTLRTPRGFVYILYNVLISNYQVSGEREASLTESFALNYTRIEVQGIAGGVKPAPISLWNLETQANK
jgi:type VI protein secretion system component Hcp